MSNVNQSAGETGLYAARNCIKVGGYYYERYSEATRKAWLDKFQDEKEPLERAPKYRFIDSLESDDYDYVEDDKLEATLDALFEMKDRLTI